MSGQADAKSLPALMLTATQARFKLSQLAANLDQTAREAFKQYLLALSQVRDYESGAGPSDNAIINFSEDVDRAQDQAVSAGVPSILLEYHALVSDFHAQIQPSRSYKLDKFRSLACEVLAFRSPLDPDDLDLIGRALNIPAQDIVTLRG